MRKPPSNLPKLPLHRSALETQKQGKGLRLPPWSIRVLPNGSAGLCFQHLRCCDKSNRRQEGDTEVLHPTTIPLRPSADSRPSINEYFLSDVCLDIVGPNTAVFKAKLN